MVKLIRLLLPLFLLLTLSCSKSTAPERFSGTVYSVACLLVSDSPINTEHPVYITRSTSIEEFDAYQLFVSDAVVQIKDLDTNEEWSLTAIPDLAEMKIKYIDLNDHPIQALHRYRLEATIPGYDKTIWAETTVPLAATVVPDIYQHGGGFSHDEATMPNIIYDQIDQLYPLAMNTGTTSSTFNFLGEMYCLEDFSTSLEFTTPVMGIDHPTSDMEDAYYAGGESIRRIKFMGRYASMPQSGMDGNYLVIKDYRQAFVFFGRYRLSLYIVDDNYYQYTFSPEGYFHGGVHNALGYFGSASGGRVYANIVKG